MKGRETSHSGAPARGVALHFIWGEDYAAVARHGVSAAAGTERNSRLLARFAKSMRTRGWVRGNARTAHTGSGSTMSGASSRVSLSSLERHLA